MNRVTVAAEEVPLPPWRDRAGDYALKALDRLGLDGWDLSVLFCNDRYIRSLNARYRNRDEATDVLSFNLGATVPGGGGPEGGGENRYLPGDIVISLETLGENAVCFKVSEDEELRRLLIHGILHLDGRDHGSNENTEPMLELQENILAGLAGERILP